MNKKLSRRDFLKLTALGTASVVVASCGPSATEAPVEAPAGEAPAAAAPTAVPPKEPVTLDFLAWGDNADLPAWEQLVQMYMERNPNVTIKLFADRRPECEFLRKTANIHRWRHPPRCLFLPGMGMADLCRQRPTGAVDDYFKRDNLDAPVSAGQPGCCGHNCSAMDQPI